MTEPERLLCVGGPADGQWINVDRRSQRWTVPIRDLADIRWAPWQTSYIPLENVANVEHVYYERLMWRCGSSERSILIPQGSSPVAAIDILMRGYRTESVP